MNAYGSSSPRAFYRSADQALLGGVCAGIAEQFGVNLRVLRVLALIALLVAMPAAIIAYLAIVILFPARAADTYVPSQRRKAPRQSRRERRAERKRASREESETRRRTTSEAAAQVRDKCQSLEARLVSLEKYITSSRYRLDEEFRRL